MLSEEDKKEALQDISELLHGDISALVFLADNKGKGKIIHYGCVTTDLINLLKADIARRSL